MLWLIERFTIITVALNSISMDQTGTVLDSI